MNVRKTFVFLSRTCRFTAILLLLLLSRVPAAPAEPSALPPLHPFNPGERLSYKLSWSNILSAGVAVMEVQRAKTAGGDDVLRFVSKAHTIGMLDKFYRVNDNVQSLFDVRTGLPLAYTMDQQHGKRKRHRELLFDHEQKKVIYRDDGKETTEEIPGNAQDALSSLYVLRSQRTFTTAKPIVIEVHDSGKNWAVEVLVLGKDRIKVPAGEFNTIKLKTYPKYEGVFMHKGEIFIWLTDDDRRIPVLMKSTITIGSIMASLTEVRTGDAAP
jgi:hypothetical protein